MIPRSRLGTDGPSVSRLCFGTLTMSASQAALPFDEGGRLLSYASGKGINFWDTAELYGTYGHIKAALSEVSELPVVSTKSYAWDRAGAEASFGKARLETGLEVIDIFMLHEQPGVLTILGAKDALMYYIDMRDKGLIGQVGISTHAIEPVIAVAYARGALGAEDVPDIVKEFDLGLLREIGVVHPIINMKGIGLLDGFAQDMENAVKAAHSAGVGVFGMKLLGGGNLLNDFGQAVDYGLSMECVDAFAVGMQSEREIDINARLFAGEKITQEELTGVVSKKRHLHIDDWCTGCGACEKRCRSGAIRIVEGRAVVDSDKCLLCSYCAASCPEFAIKVV
ncbi:MAG: aldo/keto reductase [Eubacteriales bacterium]|nr:aldo/keto reductase [Eubacteriales bacterium]